MRETPLEQAVFAFLDVETTGLDPRGDRVCEIAVLKVRDRRVLHEYSTLVNPGRPIPIEVQQINGISDAMVAFSPAFGDVAHEVSAAVEGAVLVSHNAPFDTAFVAAEFARLGRPAPTVPVLDTLFLARKHFKFPSNKLGAISKAIGIEPKGWHRASNDVQILKLIFEHFLDEFRRNGLTTLNELLVLRS